MSKIVLGILVLVGTFGSHLDEEKRYFPVGAFDKEDKEDDDLKAKRYGDYLKAMSEPSLWDIAETDRTITTYRLLWLPSFHAPISVRVAKSDKWILVHVIKLDGTAAGRPGKIASKQTRKLTADEWTLLQVRLEKCEYWKLRTSVKTDLGAGLIMDGDHLICEGVDNGRYHVVDRSDPEPEYEKMCKFFLALSGLDVGRAWAEYHDEAE